MNLEQIINLVSKQLDNIFIFDRKTEFSPLATSCEKALEKAMFSFKSCKNKYYYNENGSCCFDPFHTGQNSIFLYFLSHELWSSFHNRELAGKIYYLNKVLNSVDLFYEIELPKIFDLDHPLGSVMGRAKYSNYFFFSQNCTVGQNHFIFPEFEENVSMLSGSKVIGKSHIGKNCIIAANTFIKDTDIPSNSIVFGSSPNLVIKSRDKKYFTEKNYYWKFTD